MNVYEVVFIHYLQLCDVYHRVKSLQRPCPSTTTQSSCEKYVHKRFSMPQKQSILVAIVTTTPQTLGLDLKKSVARHEKVCGIRRPASERQAPKEQPTQPPPNTPPSANPRETLPKPSTSPTKTRRGLYQPRQKWWQCKECHLSGP